MYKGINDLLDLLQDRRLAGPEARSLVRAIEDLDDHVRSARKGMAELSLDLTTLQRAAQSTNGDIQNIAALALARFGCQRPRPACSTAETEPAAVTTPAPEDYQPQSATHDSPPYGSIDTAPGSDARLGLFDMIDLALQSLDCSAESIDDGRFVRVNLPDAAPQNVTISAKQLDEDGSRVVRISSVCGPADSGNHHKALLLNTHLVYGAIAIRQNKPGGGIWADEQFVLTEAIPEREATVEALARIIAYVAEAAGKLARQLAGR
ncbi:MAG TPA: hypothetical protein VM141_02830 [Planctomycetota bacterium]|nr:hypothetical protein [Planctomycetota bacterium]